MRKGLYGSSSLTVLIVAMSIVATAFASTIVYLETSTARVQRETEGMLSNAVPSIERLTDARATLRRLDGAMDTALLDRMAERPVDLQGIEAATHNLREDIRAYRTLPFYELEADLNNDLDAELHRLDDVEGRLETLLASGRLEAAHELENGEWRQHSNRVDDQLRTLISFNLRHVTKHALRIDHIRRRAALVGFAVGGGAIVIALAATLVAARAVRRQMQLQEERANELESFSARVAHDLMSPLSSVSMALEMACERLHDPVAGRMVGRGLSVLKRVRLVVDGLLDFARSGGKPPPNAHASVPKVLGDVVEEVRPSAEQAGVELRCESCGPVEVGCAPGILTVVVTNLVNNAIKYMAESETRLIIVRARKMKSSVYFEVEDTGPGLLPGFEDAAFEPYVRGNTKTTGLGLGLATVKRLVDAHGGRVGVRRREGAGSLFWFELPNVDARAVT